VPESAAPDRQTVVHDVVVIGGGPGGSTIAALLAARGCWVVLPEKAQHPRFHIGESLLPLNLTLFEQPGVAEEVARTGMPKYGASTCAQVDDAIA